MKSDVAFECILRRAGLRGHGGNLADVTWSNANEQGVGANTVWVGRDIGVFIVKRATSSEIGLEAVASRDVIVCSVVLDPHEVQTEFAIHETHVGADGADLTMVFVPRHERFKFAARAPNGLQAVTLVIDITALIENRGLSYGNLPVSLRRVIGARELMVEKLIPGRFGTVACEIAAHRPGLAELPELFYEAKSLDLTSALFSEIARRDALDAGGGRVGSQALERLRKVRESIDRAPHRSLDIDALARAAGMNRTKLRLVFRQVYGTTLSGYRNALLLRRADLALKEAGASVTQAAREAGYATPSGFIAAYRRQYGFSPGKVRAIDAAIVSNSCAGRD